MLQQTQELANNVDFPEDYVDDDLAELGGDMQAEQSYDEESDQEGQTGVAGETGQDGEDLFTYPIASLSTVRKARPPFSFPVSLLVSYLKFERFP